ncbi:MAG: N-acetylmuramoyl-L-alanine amidase [Alphaproteobacteria bacterium]|nr:N-acetylmuramoyl-L-alanine amidase [Alphaproteobacteria bacterium]MBO4642978.1 N-acetylmuramoyl-L-alanine amidase [Alphaproteobacteria bacterium]
MTVFRHIFCFLIFIAATVLCPRQSDAAIVQNIRLGDQSGSSVRIVVDLSEKTDFKIFPLSNPDRVVIDLPKTSFDIKESALPKKDYLNKIRLGTKEAQTGRIVLEFNRGVVIKKSFLLTPQSGFQWRLVVDLELMAKTDELKQVTPEWYDNSVTEEKKPVRQTTETPKNKPLIVLDPGHGGKDPGAIGVSGVYEKHLTLAMAKQLKTLLEKTERYRVKLTRESDEFISLYARRRFARSVNADLFVSLHADSIRKPGTRGLSVYTLSEKASDKEAEKLAESENKVDLIAGIDLSGETQEVTDILIDLARRETNNHSSYFAEKLMTEIRKEIMVLPNSHRFAGFAVLKSPDVPSVLIEMGYLSNKEEEKLLRQASYREKLAKATVRAINSYFAEKHKANFN